MNIIYKFYSSIYFGMVIVRSNQTNSGEDARGRSSGRSRFKSKAVSLKAGLLRNAIMWHTPSSSQT